LTDKNCLKKSFLHKTFLAEKINFAQKNIFWPKKSLTEKFFGRKKFWPKKSLAKKFFGRK